MPTRTTPDRSKERDRGNDPDYVYEGPQTARGRSASNRGGQYNPRGAEMRGRDTGTDVDDLLDNPPEYETPDYIYDLVDYYEEGADDIMGAAEDRLGLAQEYSDYLQESDMPGMDVYQEGIGQATATGIDALQQSGGRNLGALNQMYQSELGANRNLAISNQQYQQQAQGRAYQTMSMAFGDFANSIMGATQMRGQGMQIGAQYADQEFQVNELDPYSNKLDYAIAEQGYNRQQSMMNQYMQAQEQARKSQMWGNILGTVGTIGGAVLGGPIGAGVGGAIGSGVGGAMNQGGQNQGVNNTSNWYDFQGYPA